MAKADKGSKGQPEEREPIEADFGLGNLSLGGLFKGLGNFVELANKLAEQGEELKGGKQARIIGSRLVIPPASGVLPVPSFCIEQSRWHGSWPQRHRLRRRK